MSDNYILFTDSGADIPPSLLSEWGVGYQPLTFRFDHIDKEFSNDEMDIREFYRLMREGHIAKTSAVASAIFKDTFEAILAEGKDILYLAFSSGLSATCNNGRVAAEDAVAKFPDRKIVVVDSLAASAGQGLLLWLAVQKKREGASLEEVAQYLEDTKLHLCHVSTRGAIEAVQMAKLRGAPVTCEVTPHHLWFDSDRCDYRVNPPIRTADDVQALVDAIRTGVVDAIATDHAPHSEEDKLKGAAGMVGSETAFGVCYTKLC